MEKTFTKEPELKDLKSQLDSLSRQINLTLASKDESNKDNSEQMDVSTKIIPINSQNYPPQQSRGMRL